MLSGRRWPLGHRRRIDPIRWAVVDRWVADQLCFRGILIRLVTGASWVDIEAILEPECRARPCALDATSGSPALSFEQLKDEALAAFDRIIGLDLDDVALDGSMHKAPYGGKGTRPNPTDRATLGWKWWVASERHGIPIGWVIDGANRNDVAMLEPTLDAVAAASLLAGIGALHLDRGLDSGPLRRGDLRVDRAGGPAHLLRPRSSTTSSGRG